MKEFMFIFLGADYSSMDITPDEIDIQMKKWFDWVDKLKAEDVYIEGRALTPQTKRIADQNVVTDGPFAEAKELVGGYMIVKADSMESALNLTADFPDYELGGSVEVREIMVFDGE